MRIIPFIISVVITVGFVFLFNTRLSIKNDKTPRLGNFFSPQTGFWRNAEPADYNFSINLKTTLLKDKVDVYLDERLVPHVFAQNEHDAYFVQGYLHARFRLWQMEFQTYAAAGRLAELIGAKKGDYSILDNRDRYFRRLGMTWAAENSCKAMEANPDTKAVMDAYTDGINYYIENLKPVNYPIEYKLLDYAPEKWSNYKTALFLKYMSYDLAGYEEDFERTNAKKFLSADEYEKAYPYGRDSLDPVIPKGSMFDKPNITLKVPVNADSLYFNYYDSLKAQPQKPDAFNGSNNWAVAGSKTASGKPILCGDPHLGLNLPSLWFEMQIRTPQWNVYGVSFPGAPAIPIGFNDSIAWSETNAMRDVRDYYEIKFKDKTQNEYWFNGEWRKTEWRIERIKVSGESDYIDSIPMTVFGPVMYEKRFPNQAESSGQQQKSYAVRWKAHDPSNEGWTFIKMARAKNYNDYLDAIKTFECPGQNFVFASKNGDIAIWDQGAFPAKWRRQGDFIMPGTDSSYMWHGVIPINENPHMMNPARGFVSSANQLPTDTTYPYYLGGSYDLYRGIEINKKLSVLSAITPKDMQLLQTDNYNIMAATIVPVLLRNMSDSNMNDKEKQYADIIKKWNYRYDAFEEAPVIFDNWMNYFTNMIWGDDITQRSKFATVLPQISVLVEAVIKDSNFQFIDDRNTTSKETLRDVVWQSFRRAALDLDSMHNIYGNLSYGKIKGTEIMHLMRLLPFSKIGLNVGGGRNIINATQKNHGPSWRMVVHLDSVTDAYGVYPGGQSGNPGSKFYDTFIDAWAENKYYPLWVMNKNDITDQRIKWKISFSN